MNNILYLDDYINIYNLKNNKLITIKPYKNTLENGLIIDKDKFNKKLKWIINNNKLEKGILSDSITVITNNLYKNIHKEILKKLLEDINYGKVTFINELDFLKLERGKLFINCNNSYFYFLYLNKYGNTELNLYKKDFINLNNLKNIIDILKITEIYLYGKNYNEIKNILNREKINYYYFDDGDNLIIKMLLNNKKV